MNDFCLKQGHGLKNSAAHLYSNFPWVPPPPPHPASRHILVNQSAGRQVACEQALHIFRVRLLCDFSRLLQMEHDLERIQTREHNRKNKRTEIERFDWFIERIQKRAWLFGYISERSGEKTSCPRTSRINRYFALTSYCNTIGQSNNAFSILGF